VRTTPTTPTPRVAGGTGPVIVIDPGHSVTVHAVDPATGLDVSDYANEPEMHDVFVVAELVRTLLTDDGYRVVFTKPTLDTPTSLLRRAQIADAAHAALALSIHDQAGSSGGIGFTQGNNTVYYQSVGNYRETSTGRKVYFTDTAVAAQSRRYGQIFQAKRSSVEGVPVTLLGNTGYDLGTRGLPAGNIWLVQLLSHVPWIYNEAGGNSAGMVGLSAADEQRYARALAVAVEACVPIRG
jgi:N-acetylmuramoyl-L-alanine amidase